MSVGFDLPQQFQLRPPKLPDRPNVPFPLLECQLRFQNDHILCPADGHSFGQYLRGAFIGTIEFSHPAQVSGRKSRDVRVCVAQIFRGGYSCAFLRPAADQPPDLTVQLHLR